jgi:parallel beta-helix repeat protein
VRPHSAFFAILAMLISSSLYAATIHVPADQPTIQDGINVANNGDLVLVAAGTYSENIDFKGKAITVRSVSGAKVTVIDAGKHGSVATFLSNEGPKSILHGFTLQHGIANNFGGGVLIGAASPTIENNIIQDNKACLGGGGISTQGSPHILNNVIQNNSHTSCFAGVGGGGVNIDGPGTVILYGNVIRHNSFSGGGGGGIAVLGRSTPVLENNIIVENSAGVGESGGGLSIGYPASPLVVQNLFAGNTATNGGAISIYLSDPIQGVGPTLVNNTIVGSGGTTQGSVVWVGGLDTAVTFYNNLLIGLNGQSAVYCDGSFGVPQFTNNDAYSANGSGLSGVCASESNQNGNISADPMFLSMTNFELQSGSPAINAGDNSAPGIPAKDLAGNARIVGGTIDMGAYEFQ